jgi:O-antigen biosynthesis protein
MAGTVPVSVLVPTIGRAAQLERCLESLSRCDPRPAEILVVDQSAGSETAETVERFAQLGARTIRCAGRGISLAMNLGLREAGHETVLVTHDDCRVEGSWVGTTYELMSENRDGIVTGRVLPLGDPKRVPSTRDDPERHDYTGELRVGVLYPNNMALNRFRVLDLGGFDERFQDAAEDCDLCYRWLRAGRSLRYEPSMVVWHDDWRDDAQLDRLHYHYWHWIAFLYAKQLRRRDFAIVPFVLRSFYAWAHGAVSVRIGREPKRHANPRGFLRGFPSGFLRGWRTYGPSGSASEASRALPSSTACRDRRPT